MSALAIYLPTVVFISLLGGFLPLMRALSQRALALLLFVELLRAVEVLKLLVHQPPNGAAVPEDALIATATALLRGDADARAQWPARLAALQAELSGASLATSEQLRALAIALDASRICGDGDAGALRLARAALSRGRSPRLLASRK